MTMDENAVVRAVGRYIVADPAICHGQPTFRGTRILVARSKPTPVGSAANINTLKGDG